MLEALANLAERAGTRCAAIRWLVLWVLRRAEAVARAYAEEFTASPILPTGLYPAGDTPGDALRLAANLRMLACIFRALAHRARLASTPGKPSGQILPCCQRIAGRLRAGAVLLARRIDTS